MRRRGLTIFQGSSTSRRSRYNCNEITRRVQNSREAGSFTNSMYLRSMECCPESAHESVCHPNHLDETDWRTSRFAPDPSHSRLGSRRDNRDPGDSRKRAETLSKLVGSYRYSKKSKDLYSRKVNTRLIAIIPVTNDFIRERVFPFDFKNPPISSNVYKL